MKTVKKITRDYNSINFGFEYTMESPKTVQVKSFWGSFDTYLRLTKEIRKEGYTVIE